MKKPILATLAMALMCGLLTTNAQAGGPGSRGREIERHARKTVAEREKAVRKAIAEREKAARKNLAKAEKRARAAAANIDKKIGKALKKWKL